MKAYLDHPDSMSNRLRNARFVAKKIDFEKLRKDIDLIERFASMKIPRGRVSVELKSTFIIRQPEL